MQCSNNFCGLMFTHYVICRVKKDTQEVGVRGVLLGFAQRQEFGKMDKCQIYHGAQCVSAHSCWQLFSFTHWRDLTE